MAVRNLFAFTKWKTSVENGLKIKNVHVLANVLSPSKILFINVPSPSKILFINVPSPSKILFINDPTPSIILYINVPSPSKILFINVPSPNKILFINVPSPSKMDLVDHTHRLKNVQYGFTERLCQDPPENYFGHQHSLGRRCDNPNIRTFGYQDNTIPTCKSFNNPSISVQSQCHVARISQKFRQI